MFYIRRCIFCRTISLPSFNGLRCKLAEIALYIILGWVYDIISHLICSLSSISFAYFTHFSNLNASPELMQIFANGERGFDSFREFYAIHLKNIGARAGGGLQAPQLQIFLKLFVQNAIDSGKVLGRKHSERFSKPDLKATFSDVCLVKTGLFKIK